MLKIKDILDGAWFRHGFFLLTALSFNSLVTGYRLPTLLAAGVLAWGALVLLWRVIHLKEEKLPPFWWGCFLFLFSYGISSLMNMSYGITGNLKAMIWMAFELLLLYGAKRSLDWKKDKKEIETFVLLVILYTAVQAILSLGMLLLAHQGVAPNGIYIGVWEGRLWGSYTDPNYGAILTVVSIVFTCACLMIGNCKKVIRWGLYLNLGLQYLYLVFSYSRSGLICLALALILMFVYWCGKSSVSMVKKAAVGIFLVVLCLSGDLFREAYNVLYADVEFREPVIEERASESKMDRGETDLVLRELFADPVLTVSAQPLDEADHVSGEEAVDEAAAKSPLGREEGLNHDLSNGRFGIWKDGVLIWKSSPVYGISYRNISSYIEKNMPDSYLLDRYNALNTFHNVFVDVLVSQGVIGILLLAVMLIGMLRKGIFVIRHLEGEARAVSIFLGIAVITVCAGAMFVTDIFYINSPTAIIFWCCLGWLMQMDREQVQDKNAGK